MTAGATEHLCMESLVMAKLNRPNERSRGTFLVAMAMFVDEDRAGDELDGGDLARFGSGWHTDEGFTAYGTDANA